MNRTGTAVRRLGGARPWTSSTGLGLLAVALLVIVLVAIFQKERIATVLASTETIEAEFASDYKLVPYRSDVEVGGVVVGTVSGVSPTDSGTFVVTMEVESGLSEKLGTSPGAEIRPTLVIGGRYYVDLVPSGGGRFDEDRIPLERTALPVELDRVLGALTPPARDGIQTSITQTDATLAEGGTDAVRDLLATAPDTLDPAGAVLDAARGTRPATDLTDVVVGLQATAEALTRNDGQLDAVLRDLSTTSRALREGAEPLAASIGTSPETLRVTRAGLVDLRPTLDRLTATAADLRPAARELDPFVAQLDSTLAEVQPLLTDLRPLLTDLQPLVEQLVPVSEKATSAFQDVRGPVLDRVNGPVLEAVNEEWAGTGSYDGSGGNGHRTYEELGHLFHNASSAFGYQGPNGSLSRLTAGVSVNTLGGPGFTLEDYLEQLMLQQPVGPQPGDAAVVPPAPIAPPADQGRPLLPTLGLDDQEPR